MKNTLLILLLAGLSLPILAEDERTWRASIGAGIAVKKNNRVGNTYEDMDKKTIIRPIPFITGSVGRFSLGPQGLAFRAFGNHLMSASVYAKRDGDRYHGLNMDPRKESVFIGFSAKFFKYGLSVQKDINGRSKGYVTQLNYGEFFKISEGLILRAGLSLEWNDDRYAEYYYSVKKSEATADRPEYHLNNYILPGISFLPIYKVSENASVTAALGIKFLPKKVRNSPTMNGDKLDIGGLVGFSYNL